MNYLKHKPGSIEEISAKMSNYATESEYKKVFKKELEKSGKGIGAMTPAEKKNFFNDIDSKYTAKNEEDAYDNDRFIIKNGKATVDNSNTADNKDHVHAPNAKIALQLHKQGKKVYKEEVTEADDGDKRKDDPCWKGYKMVGMKNKGGKEVPNCVPMTKEELEEAGIKEEDVMHESMIDAVKSVWQMAAEEQEKKGTAEGEPEFKNPKNIKSSKNNTFKGKADTGTKKTQVQLEPEVDYKN